MSWDCSINYVATNCSGVKQLSIFKEEVKRQELNLNKTNALVLERIKWHIITSENGRRSL